MQVGKVIVVLSIKSSFGYLKSGDKCLDIPGGDAYDGAQLWVWDCISGSANQAFTRSTYLNDEAIAVEHPSSPPSFCVDSGSIAAGTNVMLWDCNGLQQQHFQYQTTSYGSCAYLKTSSGLCLQRSSLDNGAGVTVDYCSNACDDQQIWEWGTGTLTNNSLVSV
mmetsp:Transcript_64136/g.169989  ORF Transcript_64136/g.169989 Transcript_64136/m.169989 type:complete len:164 (-) Transcript_64136:118-609(-)